MNNYEEAIKIMDERFGKDSLVAIATTDGDKMYNRIIDVYYTNGSFYTTTGSNSRKIKQVELHPEVAVAATDWFTGQGIGKNLGWILNPENAEIRLKLKEAFSAWYDIVINEEDKNSCILEIKMTEGILTKDHGALRYKMDFSNKSAEVSENFGEFK